MRNYMHKPTANSKYPCVTLENGYKESVSTNKPQLSFFLPDQTHFA